MTVSTQRHTPIYSHTIGLFVESGGGFSNPYDVAVTPDNVLYVINRSNGADAPLGGLRIAMVTYESDYLGEFGRFGTDDGELVWPVAIGLGRDSDLYISDEHRHDVQVFDHEGTFRRKLGRFGSGPGQFNRPAGLALDQDETLLVADALNHRVQRLALDGRPLAAWGEPGDAPGQLNMPWGIAVDHQGQVYVSDWRNDRVQKFTPNGHWLATFGGPEAGEGRLKRPTGLAVGPDGTLYVADWGNNQVVVYDADGGVLAVLLGEADLSTWAREYLEADQELAARRATGPELEPERRFWGPTAVKLDHAGRLLVVESCRHRIQIYQT